MMQQLTQLLVNKNYPTHWLLGQASVLIFPDLNTGNNTYKAVQRETGALAITNVTRIE
jgi:phosphate acetyltransferase